MTARLRRTIKAQLAHNESLRAELAESDRILETVTECTLTGWWDWPLDQPRASMSAGFWHLLGYSEPQPPPADWLTCLDAEERSQVRAELDAWLSQGGQQRFSSTQQYQHQDGEQVWLHCTCLVLDRDAEGRPARLVGGHSDITAVMDAESETLSQLKQQTTELRRLNRALETRTAALQRANSALEDFAYAASHDLQAPLRAIAHFATWIEEDLPEDATEAVRMYVHQLRDRVERMTRLQENLLAYARITGQEAAVVSVNMPAVIRDVWLLAQPPDEFRLVLRGDDRLQVRVEERGLRTILRNLMSNAINHHDQAAGTVTVTYALQAGAVRVEVADDGPGVPPNEADRIFRATHTGTSPNGGTGMGLAIARRHAEHSGGEVVLLPTEGRGAVFRVDWPLHQIS